MGFSVEGNLQNRYKVGVSYNIAQGGEYDPAVDRDFAAISFSYAF